MRKFFSLAFVFVALCSPAHAQLGFSTTPIVGKVAAGSQVVLSNFYIYNLNPCRSMPTPMLDGREAKLGKVTANVVQRARSKGPCGPDFKYEMLQVSYQPTASSGTDQFQLYVHDGYQFTPIPVRVTIGGGRPAQAASSLRATAQQQPETNNIPRRCAIAHPNIKRTREVKARALEFWRPQEILLVA